MDSRAGHYRHVETQGSGAMPPLSLLALQRWFSLFRAARQRLVLYGLTETFCTRLRSISFVDPSFILMSNVPLVGMPMRSTLSMRSPLTLPADASENATGPLSRTRKVPVPYLFSVRCKMIVCLRLSLTLLTACPVSPVASACAYSQQRSTSAPFALISSKGIASVPSDDLTSTVIVSSPGPAVNE